MKGHLTAWAAAFSAAMLVGASGCTVSYSKHHDKRPDSEVVREVKARMASIADDLAARGPSAWLDHFADIDGFSMASEGRMHFASYAEAEEFVAGFAAQVESMSVEWNDMRVDVLEPHLAVATAGYREVIDLVDGEPFEFSGYFSGVFVDLPSGWRLQHLHWSELVADP